MLRPRPMDAAAISGVVRRGQRYDAVILAARRGATRWQRRWSDRRLAGLR